MQPNKWKSITWALIAVRRGELLAAAESADLGATDRGAAAVGLVELLHDGLGLIEGGIARDRRPRGLPEELWPPPEVRSRVRLADRASRGESRRLLLEWLAGSASS